MNSCGFLDNRSPASTLNVRCHIKAGHETPHQFRYWRRLVNILQWRMKNDHDNVIAIDGEEGSGKSTLAVQLAKSLDPAFDPETIMYDFRDLDENFQADQKGRVYLIDEGANLAFSRDFASYGNKQLVKLLMQVRQLNSTIIFCIPNFWWLDKYLREHRVKFWIHVQQRGEAVVLQRQQDWRTGSTRFKELFIKPFPGPDPKSPFWMRYLERKRTSFIENYGRQETETSQTGEEDRIGFANRPGRAV